MRFTMKTLAAFCTLALAMNTGCADDAGSLPSDPAQNPIMESNTPEPTANIVPDNKDESDCGAAAAATCSVSFSGETASVSGSGAAAAGNIVTITSAGVYRLTGSGTGKVIVDAGKDDEVTLVLDNFNLTSSEGSAILCTKAAKLIVNIPEGKTASLCDSESYTFEADSDEPDAALFSKCNTVINGGGALSVSGLYKGGVKCKDGLKICLSGSLSVNSADDGIKGRDYLIITGGTIDVTSGADGLVSTNTEDSGMGYVNICGGDITICSETDGIQAATELIIDAGDINVLSGGGSASVEFKEESLDRPGGFGFFGTATDNSTDDTAESQKALKGVSAVKINGGTFLLDCADDAVHSNGSVTISDGVLTISAGDDGVHADEQLFVSGGTIDITKCCEGLEGKQIELSGGSINIVSFNDGINATSGSGSMLGGEAADGVYISISGGDIIVNASGDGLDSNGTVAMSGGYVTVYGSTSNNNGALDYESSFAVSGGTLIALGSSGMAQVPSTLSQPCLSVSAQVAAGAVLEVRDESGAVVISTTTPKACGSLIFSSDKFIAEKDYSVFSDGVLIETITAKDGVAGSGGSGFGGFGGGGRGNNRPAGNKPQQPGQGELPNGEKPTPPDGVTDFGGRGDRVQFDVTSDMT